MKNAILLFLMILIGVLVLRNSSLKSTLVRMQAYTSPVTQVVSSPPHAFSTPGVKSSVSRTVTASSDRDSLNSLLNDQKVLQSQIQDASEASIDQQIVSTQQEISALQNQLKDYQSSQSSLQQSATTQLRFQEALNRQTSAHIRSQIRALERQIRASQKDLAIVNHISDLDQPEHQAQLQTSIQQLQAAVQTLIAEQDSLQNQANSDTVDLSDQVNGAMNQYAQTQSALSTKNTSSVHHYEPET